MTAVTSLWRHGYHPYHYKSLNQAKFVHTFEKLKAFPCVDQHKFHTSVYFIVIHCIVYNGYIVSREGKSVYLNWLNATCAIISNEASVQNWHTLIMSDFFLLFYKNIVVRLFFYHTCFDINSHILYAKTRVNLKCIHHNRTLFILCLRNYFLIHSL